MNRKNVARRQVGATIVEFALALVVFLTFLLGIADFGRMLFTWNAATEATRAGARYAVVCDNTARKAAVVGRMQQLLPQITSSNVNVTWTPTGCSTATCEGVTVSITGLNYQWISPVAGLASVGAITMPSFSTFLPRERMYQDPHSAAICS
jgi:Flp pilus assembly protein TadG